MTDKELLLDILSRHYTNIDDVSIESIIYCFLNERGKDFSALRLNRWIQELNNMLYTKQINAERAIGVTLERATYIKRYLEGNMYTSEEAAKAHVDVQIANAQAIIDAVNEV